MLKSGAEPLASTCAHVTKDVHQDESGAGGNPGSSQEDSVLQPAEIVEPMELEESMKCLAEGQPLEITLPVNPLSFSTGCTVTCSCNELQNENRQLWNKAKSLQKNLLAKGNLSKFAKGVYVSRNYPTP